MDIKKCWHHSVDHFRDITKMVDIGSNTTCKILEVLDFFNKI